MKWISEQSELGNSSEVGGKGAHLQKLVSWKASVPPFFILTTQCFDYYETYQALPLEVSKRFEAFFKDHSEIALRSSMIAEDHIDSSFAGLFDTLLNVTSDNWQPLLLQIYSSLKSDRVVQYIAKKNLTVDLKMAVVAQALVKVDKSGVLFSRSPLVPTSAVAIDAAFGMGEGVVSGTSDVDHYKLTRTGEMIETINNNTELVLNESEIQELLSTAISLEEKNGKPSDIEWGYKNKKLYIFQIRPITRSFEPLTFYVDTNLSESYPGVVSPFTAGFVQKAYENVFKESAKILGASPATLGKLNFHYERLIGSLDDHLYYNLEHYYAVLRALPGGEKNIDNWHKMIGGRMEGHTVPYYDTRLSGPENIIAVWSLLKFSMTRKKTFDPFIQQLNLIKDEVEGKTTSLISPVEIISYLHQLINRPLGFGLTVINDVFVMIGLGFLTRMLKRKGHNDDEVIELLKTTNGVDSLKPLEKFNELIAGLSDQFLEDLENFDMNQGLDPYKSFFLDMRKKGFDQEVSQLKTFLAEFGDRSFEELKLESLPLKNNPHLLKELVVWGKNHASLKTPANQKVSIIKLNWIENKILRFTRESIETREATRLWRGKFYHLLRELMLKLGSELKRTDPSFANCSTMDFFSVSHEEWLSFSQNNLSSLDIQTLMKRRKSWQTKRRQYPELLSWVASEALPDFENKISFSTGLTGQGVSQGVTEGYALVLDKPDEALKSNLKDFILVTKNTDPAWVYIMSRSLGLVSEKGSLLSHTAIIGRELNIPTLVGVKDATRKIKTGDRIRLDATSGKIEFI